ncbi:MAG: hypothetical protein AAGG02_02585 [Cyanobacteria bacterium P01_H01_bin.15]
MDIELLNQPESSIARIVLSAGEDAVAEAGCMVSMSSVFKPARRCAKAKEVVSAAE